MKDEEDNNGSEEQNNETPAITVKVSEGPSVSEDSWETSQQIDQSNSEEEKSTEEQEEKKEEQSTEDKTEQKEESKEEEKQDVQTNIDETAVLNFLKEKGITAEKLEDLKPKEVKALTPEVEKYLELLGKNYLPSPYARGIKFVV